MTNENWPLIGPLNEHGAFAACGLSGFGTMTACAAGELCAEWVMGNELPEYAFNLSMQRYENKTLMHELESAQDKGLL
jgi:glycine/D-amino acid oxidase-like deaminating enzyme